MLNTVYNEGKGHRNSCLTYWKRSWERLSELVRADGDYTAGSTSVLASKRLKILQRS